MEFGILGKLVVFRDGFEIDLGPNRQRQLLALLLTDPNSIFSSDQIVDALWGEVGVERAGALRVHVSRLRKVLEPNREPRSTDGVLITSHPGYLIQTPPDSVDSQRFERLLGEGRQLSSANPAKAAEVLREALALWRGPAFEDFQFESFARNEIARLEELRLEAVGARIDADLRLGQSRELASELEALVRLHPLREEFTGQLMLALYRSGRQAEALRAYQLLRTNLVEELGIEPSAPLRDLEDGMILGGEHLDHHSPARSPVGVDLIDMPLESDQGDPGMAPRAGLTVRGYELHEQIGQGSVGRVYRATQTSVGREVAIKVVRPELANDPAFIRQFEAEAQLIAQLEHPHIVPLFDYWREPDAAYLVMRLMKGGHLSGLIGGEIDVHQVVSILDQVAEALHSAHMAGVAHGDIKPDNLLIDVAGNAYLSDFGIAVRHGEADTETSTSTLAPPYASPEHRGRAGVTTASDIYSLAIVAAQMLGGRGVTRAELSANLTPPMQDVIGKATAEDPNERYGSVVDFASDVRAALTGATASSGATESPRLTPPSVSGLSSVTELFSLPTAAPTARTSGLVTARNPYKGLRAFGAGDAEMFAGRERVVERVIARLQESGEAGRFVALVGPSGSGKSSVIRAGVIPAVRRGELQGSDTWFVVTMTPRSHPFASLADALRSVATGPPENLVALLGSRQIVDVVNALIPDPDAQILLVIDQLEELFSHSSTADADAFMNAIGMLATASESRLRIVATLRSDFYDHPLRHRRFGKLLEDGTEIISPMTTDELRRAVTAPAAAVGVSFEPGLMSLIEEDMAGQGTALPLLQYALTELFEARVGSVMTVDAYEDLGGVSGALAQRAEEIHGGMGADDQRRSREVFERLVTLNDGGPDTRRRALVSELTDGDHDGVQSVLDLYGAARLLSFDRDPASRAPTVDMAHEALLTHWKRFDEWIDDARDDIRRQRLLAASAATWRSGNRDLDFLLRGSQLSPYDGWLDAPPLRLTGPDREFLKSSYEQLEVETRTEQNRIRRLRRLTTAMAVALAIALVAGGVAFSQRRSAQEQTALAEQAADVAEVAALISGSASVGRDDPELGLLLALEAQRREPGQRTDQAILAALSTATIANRIGTMVPLSAECGVREFTGFDREVATQNGRMLARTPATRERPDGEIIDLGPAPAPCAQGDRNDVMGFAQPQDGRSLWLGPDLQTEVRFDVPTVVWEVTTDFVLAARVLSDHDELVILDARTGELHSGPVPITTVVTTAKNDDGSLFAVSASPPPELLPGGGALTYVIDTGTGQVITEYESPFPNELVFDDRTGQLILASLDDGRVILIDPFTGETGSVVDTGNTGGVAEVGVLESGLIAIVYWDEIRLVDRETGSIGVGVPVSRAIEADVQSNGLVTVWSGYNPENDSGVAVFDLESSAAVGRTWDIGFRQHAALGAGQLAAVDSESGNIAIVDLETGVRTEPSLRDGSGREFEALAVFPAADGLRGISADHVLAHWQDERLVSELYLGSEPGMVGDLWQGSGTMFGDYFAVHGRRSDRSEEAVLVRLRPGPPEVVFTVPTGPITGVAHPTGDGGLYVLSNDGVLFTYGPDGVLVGELATGATIPDVITLDPTGSRLAFGSLGTGQVFILHVATGTFETVPGVTGSVRITAGASVLGFNGDGSELALHTRSGELRLYSVGGGSTATVWTGEPLEGAAEPGWFDPATGTIWMPTGSKAVEMLLDGRQWAERACRLVGRTLTQQEWDLYVPGNQPLQNACGL